MWPNFRCKLHELGIMRKNIKDSNNLNYGTGHLLKVESS